MGEKARTNQGEAATRRRPKGLDASTRKTIQAAPFDSNAGVGRGTSGRPEARKCEVRLQQEPMGHVRTSQTSGRVAILGRWVGHLPGSELVTLFKQRAYTALSPNTHFLEIRWPKKTPNLVCLPLEWVPTPNSDYSPKRNSGSELRGLQPPDISKDPPWTERGPRELFEPHVRNELEPVRLVFLLVRKP